MFITDLFKYRFSLDNCKIKKPQEFKSWLIIGIKFIDKDWNKYGHLLYRFSDEEDVGLPFEYEKETPFGKSFTQQEIKENMTTIQQWLDNRGMVY